ncbi:ShlB/FhaC/HecB family hemolysin secretion/activation protein [Massilia sp. LjRoot122]|uniref:ShlB/FhaC/HecB family hemolysin secretion/activation protein n=1 Tax=Massilia sp. LjRoot122 TaxID=3342257 RepID=UPI003ECDBAF0
MSLSLAPAGARSRSPVLPGILSACALFGAAGQACAQVPDAGRALREATPPLPPPRPPAPTPLQLPAAPLAPPVQQDGASFVLRGVSFVGNTRFSSEHLHTLMADQLGRQVNLAQLQVLAERVNTLYRDADYILTRTTIPVQDVTGGQVQFSVLEGRLGKVRIERIDDVRVHERQIEAIVASLPTDRPLTQRELERAMLMLSDMPGMSVQASIETGEQAGSFDLILEIKSVPRYSLSVDADNHGSKATGEYRAGVMARLNGPFGRGDNLDVRLMSSFGKGLNFGRVSYEAPLGPSGLRAGVAYSHVRYELGEEFSALDAYGTADVLEFSATYPVLRSRLRNLFAKASLEYKQLDDRIGAVDIESDKRIQSLGLGLVYERRDRLFGGGYSSASITLFVGKLDLRSPEDLAADQDALGYRTDGRFVRASYVASRLQSITPAISAYVAVAGQFSNKNLASADKIAVGGPRAVRAFSSASGIGDEAHIANIELRWSATPDTSLSVFYDIGRVRIYHRPRAGAMNTQTLSGAGLGLYWNLAQGMALRASLAWQNQHTGAPVNSAERNPRAYVQLIKTF